MWNMIKSKGIFGGDFIWKLLHSVQRSETGF